MNKNKSTEKGTGMSGVQQMFLLFVLGLGREVQSKIPGRDLALRQPAWQSNTLANHTADKAVDGLFASMGEWGNHCAISGGHVTEIKWIVDLGSIKSIDTIFIFYRTDGRIWRLSPFPGRFLGFSVLVQNRTHESDSFVFFRDSAFSNTTIPQTWTHTNPVQGRYVVYHNSRAGDLANKPGYSTWAYLDLCEVIVFGCPLGFYGLHCSQPCPSNCRHCNVNTGECIDGCRNGYAGHQCKEYTRQNMALFQPTQATYLFFDYAGSELVVDGKKSDTTFQGRACLVTQNGRTYAEWRLDLQFVHSIERVIVYFRTDNVTWDRSHPYTARPLGFSIIVSNTTNPLDGVVCFKEKRHTRTTIPRVFHAECLAVGRYVFYSNERLPDMKYPSDYSKHAYADICEVEVYGCPFVGYNGAHCSIPCFSMCEDRYLENLAFKKPTWQSTTLSEYTSEKAVDGNTTRHYLHGHCAITLDTLQAAVWWVNLEAVRDIAYIVIYFRTDDRYFNRNNDLAGFPLGFSLYISNTTNKDEGVMCFHDNKYTRDTIPETLNITCPYKGQYVIYYNERIQGRNYPPFYNRYARADLCEVEVYGCPVQVDNPPECFLPCPVNCQECYAGTGLCKKCYDAYEGDICQYEKPGENCQIEF